MQKCIIYNFLFMNYITCGQNNGRPTKRDSMHIAYKRVRYNLNMILFVMLILFR